MLRRVADWAGWDIDSERLSLLGRFADWLRDEAAAAGGIGPNEGERILARHVADSLLFSAGWPSPDAPDQVVDLGSGVGLPAVPLAILWPTAQVTAVDRSGRRIGLARRAGRVLGLDNFEAVQAEAAEVTTKGDFVVARAAAEPDVVGAWARRILRPGGRIVLGGSHTQRPDVGEGQTILEVPPEILDHRVWLRMMAP